METDKSLNKVVQAVVELRTTATRNFDTELSGISSATGFIVDKQRGIILTNRHVVESGPVVAEATLYNGKEITVYPLYRDPVHDYGFFRIDTADLESMKFEEIPLAPEAAIVGLEIRVVGNDSGEKLSIIPGTLAQLDAEAPQYDDYGYNDFNTFYMQEAIGTIGGSSGSPVIDSHGQAVGLHAGSETVNATSFCLPLDRVVRALKILQNCKDESANNIAAHIPRGTLQMTLVYKGFYEARRLGLQRETEQLVRQAFPAGTGILVIDSLVPGGPAHKMQLEEGDLLLRVNGEIVTHFLTLETLLDDNVGKSIDLEVERGGVPLKITLEVQDLHSISPDYFLEVSGGVIHPLSYQQARNFRMNCGLVYVAEPGHMLSKAGVPRRSIIKRFAGKEITQVQDFISVLSKLSRGARVPLKFVNPKDPHRTKSALVTVDRQKWYAEPELYTRDDVTGLWKRSPAIISWDTAKQPQPYSSNGEVSGMETDSRKPFYSNYANMPYSNVSTAEKVIEPSLVRVLVDIPTNLNIDGVKSRYFSGTGVVIYHSKTMGIVLVDKNTVPISISDITIQFRAYPMEIQGDVVFLHPVHNYALVAYDPAALSPSGAAAVRAADLLPEPALRKGDAVYLVGLDKSFQAESRKSFVTDPTASLDTDSSDSSPLYRAMNIEFIELDSDFAVTYSGVLTDKQGQVQALWGRFSKQVVGHDEEDGDEDEDDEDDDEDDDEEEDDNSFVGGIPIYSVSKVLDSIINGSQGPPLLINGIKTPMPLVRSLEAELRSVLVDELCDFGLNGKWIRKLNKTTENLLVVEHCIARSKGKLKLETDDIILAINGKPVTNFRDVENACERLNECNDVLKMKIIRNNSEMEVTVGTDVRDGFGTRHFVGWCGSLIQETPSVVRVPAELKGGGVYVSRSLFGSPVDRYSLESNQWIVQINGIITSDLNSLINVTKELQHGEYVRVETISLDGSSNIITIKQDLHYWPTWELIFNLDTARWDRKTINALDDGYQHQI